LAYWAGYFDGEGCVRIDDGVRVSVTNTYLPALRSLVRAHGGRVRLHALGEWPKRNTFVWEANGPTACDFLRKVLPYLVEKHRQAVLALAWPDHKPGSTQRSLILIELKALKRMEHTA
jgi:hypothetical protein